tara:strand:+ start:638 stop:880 length:243 start_codon:yes stop_codon:yes gene_type:complete
MEYLAVIMYCLSLNCTSPDNIAYEVSEPIPMEKCYETLVSIYESTKAGRPDDAKWHMLCVQKDVWEARYGENKPTSEGTI